MLYIFQNIHLTLQLFKLSLRVHSLVFLNYLESAEELALLIEGFHNHAVVALTYLLANNVPVPYIVNSLKITKLDGRVVSVNAVRSSRELTHIIEW